VCETGSRSEWRLRTPFHNSAFLFSGQVWAEDKDGRKIEITAENQNAVELAALLKSLTSDQKSIEGK